MKVGFFITARLKSERLKNKILLDLNGISVIDRVIQRCKLVEGIDGIVLATSVNPQDSMLYLNAQNSQIQFYPGSEDDVLFRLEMAASYYSYDAFLSITADNPLFSIESSKIVLDIMREGESDFVFSKGLPIGCNVNGIRTSALRVANHMKKESNTEIWGPFVNRGDFFNIKDVHIIDAPYDESRRLTIDYIEDYNLFQELFRLSDGISNPSTYQILENLKKNPDLWNMNLNQKQRFPSKEVIEGIRNTFDNQIEMGKNYAKTIGKKLYPGYNLIEIPY